MTVKEFATQYKSKNPQFSNMDDLTVAQMVARHYPDWKTKIDFTGENQKPQPVVQSQPVEKKKTLLDKAANLAENTVGKASDFLFGTTSKTVGSLIGGGIGAGMELLGNDKQKEAGKKLVDQANKNINPINTVFTALELYPGGGAVSDALKKLPGGKAIAEAFSKIPEGLREGAIKQYSEALGATTKELKSKTEKIVPELLQKGVKGGLNTLEKISSQGIEDAGKAIKTAENSISVFKQQKVKPIIDKAYKLRNSYIVNGKVLDESAVKSIDNVISSIDQFGHTIPETQLIKIKRVLDKSVSIANKNFTKEEGLSLANEAKQGMVNTIRGILNSENPKLALANKEFSTWANLNKIVNATLERRSTQSGGITKLIAPIVAGGAGFAGGGGIMAAIGYFGTQEAIKLLQSPAYKTISAVNKNKLAEYLASGKIKEATLLTTKLLNGIKNSLSE